MALETPIRTKTFTVDRARYLKAMWAWKLARKMAMITAYFAALLGCLAVAFSPERALAALPIVVVLLIAMPVIRYFVARNNVYRPSSWKVFEDPRTMEFSHEGVHSVTEGGVDSQIPWTHIDRAERIGPFTMLFMTKIQHFAIPDDAWNAEADRNAFNGLIESKNLFKKK